MPSQYIYFSGFAGIGSIGKRYIKSGGLRYTSHFVIFILVYVYIVYTSKGYIDVVAGCADVSMARAVDDVKAIAGYEESGEWVITDARHDSTSNAYHTTVPWLSGR